MATSLQNAGLTPQQPIVNADGTPTTFFFRWLLAMKAAQLAAIDLEILESFAGGPLEAAFADVSSAAADARMVAESDGARAAALYAGIQELEARAAFSGAARALNDSDGDRYALEALYGSPAPAAAGTPPVLVDTLANWTLDKYNPAAYPTGQQFLVTDWEVLYTIVGGAWMYTSGIYVAPAAARPSTGFNGAALGPNDKGLGFLSSDTWTLQYWVGNAWVGVGGASAPIITSFAPGLMFGGSPGGGIVLASATGISIVAGKVVTVQVNISLMSKGTNTGSAQITGLPLPSVTTINAPGSPLVSANMAGLTAPVCQVPAAATWINLYQSGAAGVTPVSDANFNDNSIIQATVTYTTP